MRGQVEKQRREEKEEGTERRKRAGRREGKREKRDRDHEGHCRVEENYLDKYILDRYYPR